MLFRTLKRMIAQGNLDGLEEKMDIFYAAGRLSAGEYNALCGLLAEKKAEAANGDH